MTLCLGLLYKHCYLFPKHFHHPRRSLSPWPLPTLFLPLPQSLFSRYFDSRIYMYDEIFLQGYMFEQWVFCNCTGWKVVETLESGALPQEMNHGDGPGGLIVQHYFLPTPCFLTTHTIWPADAPPTPAALLLSCGTLFNCDPQSCLYGMCLSS